MIVEIKMKLLYSHKMRYDKDHHLSELWHKNSCNRAQDLMDSMKRYRLCKVVDLNGGN